jgi:membrane-bound metal-dependent hydrolase YbcI (DUF457 family)
MPFTPLHFGPGAAIHALAPKHVSFLAFCGANVLIDIEPLYYILTNQDPLHRFFHTYVGATLILAATIAIFMAFMRLSATVKIPNVLSWQALRLPQVMAGSAVGSYSHIVLDSVMHADIHPFSPFSEYNGLYGIVSIETLHLFCFASAGFTAVLILARRIKIK